MLRQNTLEKLRALEPELRQQGLAALYLFGSAARDELDANSDIDLFCELDPNAHLGFGFFAIADRLTKALGRAVDLTTRDGLHPLIRDDVSREAVRVF